MKSYLNRSSISDAGFYKRGIGLMTTMIFLAGIQSCDRPKELAETEQDLQITVCGTVQFAGECGEEADSLISLGLALTHNMTYEEAEMIFAQVVDQYPDCFWGPWGQAMTFIHPLWSDAPPESRLQAGWELSRKSMKMAQSERQRQFATALAAYYQDGISKTEQERLRNFHQAWESAFEQFPDDLEIKSFYALSLIAVADPNDKNYEKQLKAGKLAEEILQTVPEHPGGIHYTIHAYDYPELAEKAIQAAENYSTIAPDVAHALHMPTHIYTRLGMWEKSIDWNRRSAKAALTHPADGAVSMHYFHALDYIVYAHLQRLEDEQVEMILKEVQQLQGPVQEHNATAYTLAALENRFALERQNWKKAAQIQARTPSFIDWEKFPEFEALFHYTAGLGAARSGQNGKAIKALQELENIKQKIKYPYWANQVDIQRETVNAWLLLAQGKKQEAVESMRLAAEMEKATSKHPITPGELLPASELLGDMLMELGKPEEALTHYEEALMRSPLRFNSLFGAAKAAETIGDVEKANDFYETLLSICPNAEVPNTKREHALSYLKKI